MYMYFTHKYLNCFTTVFPCCYLAMQTMLGNCWEIKMSEYCTSLPTG